ncbi:MAG TPA: SH3 domain-containing protein [Rhizobiaceae bacterium]|nr:SH3 domain-containing protein [Rhizobiaceae bacterium]
MLKPLTVAFLLAALPAGAAHATSGPGCLYVVNVGAGDTLNMRARPSASARVTDRLVPGQHGIIHLDAACSPKSRPWGQRWCPVTHYNGDRTTKGWVKARFVRDSECP